MHGHMNVKKRITKYRPIVRSKQGAVRKAYEVLLPESEGKKNLPTTEYNIKVGSAPLKPGHVTYIVGQNSVRNICKLTTILDMIYLLTAIGLSPGGRSTVHIYTQTIHRTIQNKQYIEQHNNWKSADRAPSWLVIPWHLPYNRGKSTEKPQSG